MYSVVLIIIFVLFFFCVGQLKKTQTERAVKKLKEEEDRKAKELEEARQKEEEEMRKDSVVLPEGQEMNGDISENSNSEQSGFNSSVVCVFIHLMCVLEYCNVLCISYHFFIYELKWIQYATL